MPRQRIVQILFLYVIASVLRYACQKLLSGIHKNTLGLLYRSIILVKHQISGSANILISTNSPAPGGFDPEHLGMVIAQRQNH